MRPLALAALVGWLVACGSGGPAELLKTARFEEQQFNPAHARELYQEIVTRYPESPEAATARERLQALAAGH